MAATNRGAITRDGCAVEVYLQLPPAGEPELVHALVPQPAAILDLGAGVGRIAHPLVRLGHRVVAVDDSAQMLSYVHDATTVESSIEDLRLTERFDVVLMASYLINNVDETVRNRLLVTIAHHLKSDGVALMQWHPPGWFDALGAGRSHSGQIGELYSELHVHSSVHDRLAASVRYRKGQVTWSQDFVACRLSRSRVSQEVRRVGLELADHQALKDGWLLARRATQQRLP